MMEAHNAQTYDYRLCGYGPGKIDSCVAIAGSNITIHFRWLLLLLNETNYLEPQVFTKVEDF